MFEEISCTKLTQYLSDEITDLLFQFINTVESVYNDHPWDFSKWS